MIGALEGKVFRHHRNPLILMVAGVGYSVSVPQKLLTETAPGQTLTLFIQTYVREDTLSLFGFRTEEELELFELLQTVSGVGPRTALAIIDRGVASVKKAVAASDVDFFTTIPRLGRKNAQKIIIELKSKLGSTRELDLSGSEMGETREIIEALSSMGFTHQEIVAVVKKLDLALPLAQNLKTALQLLGTAHG